VTGAGRGERAPRAARRVTEVSGTGELRAWVRAERQAGRRVALVPTMGYLHEGHLALVDAARGEANAVVMSLFVNPLQFGPSEDLASYPRDLERDRTLAAGRGVDLLFVPTADAMYPPGSEVRVVPGPTAMRWEGEHRPGHFTGVLTVVAKLFHLVQPDVAVFGRKDYQQATLIRRMVHDLDFPLQLVITPTVREADGLALSSRNTYLTAVDRAAGLGLSRALRAAVEAWCAGEQRVTAIRTVMEHVLGLHPGLVVEYIAIADPDTLEPVDVANARTVIMVAGRAGRTRLLDNAILGEGL
jgi:pantoate--beta-alanine ligase